MYIGGASKSDTTKYYVSEWVFVLYHIVAKIRNNYTLHKKWSFPLRISPVNVSKFADLDTFTGEILNGKLHFLCSDTRCSVKKKSVLKTLAIFTGKQLRWRLLLIELQVFRSITLLKRVTNKSAFLWIFQSF